MRENFRGSLDSLPGFGYNDSRRALQTCGFARLLRFFLRNRHLAEWRFLLSVNLIDTVIHRMWNVNVIGISNTPFRKVWRNRLPNLPRPSGPLRDGCILSFWHFRGNMPECPGFREIPAEAASPKPGQAAFGLDAYRLLPAISAAVAPSPRAVTIWRISFLRMSPTA